MNSVPHSCTKTKLYLDMLHCSVSFENLTHDSLPPMIMICEKTIRIATVCWCQSEGVGGGGSGEQTWPSPGHPPPLNAVVSWFHVPTVLLDCVRVVSGPGRASHQGQVHFVTSVPHSSTKTRLYLDMLHCSVSFKILTHYSLPPMIVFCEETIRIATMCWCQSVGVGGGGSGEQTCPSPGHPSPLNAVVS